MKQPSKHSLGLASISTLALGGRMKNPKKTNKQCGEKTPEALAITIYMKYGQYPAVRFWLLGYRVCVSGEKTIQAGGFAPSPADLALLHWK